jgi:hypothetical protein
MKRRSLERKDDQSELWGVPLMLAVLERQERARNEMMAATDQVFRTLKNGMPIPDRDDFLQFIRAGGITPDDYRTWLRGEFARERVPGQGFMRLVTDNGKPRTPGPIRRVRDGDDNGPRAA